VALVVFLEAGGNAINVDCQLVKGICVVCVQLGANEVK
jgi:hypothetical protein